MNRRSFLKTTAVAGLVTPMSGLVIPGITRAAKPASTNGIWATKFPGNVTLKNMGTIENLPATSSRLYMNFWHKASVAPTNSSNVQYLLRAGITNPETPSNTLEVFNTFASGPGIVSGVYTVVRMTGPGSGISFYGGPLRYDNIWQNIAFSVDASSRYCQMTLDNTPVTTRIDNGAVGTNQSVNWAGRKIQFASSGTAMNKAVNPLNAAMAEFYLWADVAPDPTDSALQAHFYDPNAELPIHGMPDGGQAFGDQKPIIYFWGGGSVWALNTPNYDFTWNSMTDNGANAFTVVTGGPLQTANNDPWGFTGES